MPGPHGPRSLVDDLAVRRAWFCVFDAAALHALTSDLPSRLVGDEQEFRQVLSGQPDLIRTCLAELRLRDLCEVGPPGHPQAVAASLHSNGLTDVLSESQACEALCALAEQQGWAARVTPPGPALSGLTLDVCLCALFTDDTHERNTFELHASLVEVQPGDELARMLPAPLFVVNPLTSPPEVLAANPAAVEISAGNPTEMLRIVTEGLDMAALPPRWRRAVRLPEMPHELFVELRAGFTSNGDVLVQAMDVSDMKRVEEALQRAKRVAEEANQAKSLFLANMSHEIRTPMNAVIGFTRLVLAGELAPRERNHLEMVLESARGLLAVINDILDYSRIEAGKLVIEERPFSLRRLLRGVVREHALMALEKRLKMRLKLDARTPDMLLGDPDRLRQVLVNLLGNAIKFTPHGGIALHAGPDDAQSGQMRFAVTDTGVGIPADKLEAIFERFTQLHEGPAGQLAGTGLGLAICKKLVQAMGGGITVRSTPGAGSAFSFHLPLRPLAGEGAPETVLREDSAQVPKEAPSPKRVLLVEDNAINREYGRALLEQGGHSVTCAENGRLALEALERESYDVVLMDVQMPELDGLETTRCIRADTSGRLDRRIPIIGLSAYAMKGDRERFLGAGMDDYLTKPLEPEALHDALIRLAPQSPASRTEPHSLRHRLIRMFLDETPAQLQSLSAAVETHDAETIMHLAHSLAGTAATLKEGRLQRLALELEQIARSGQDVSAISQLLAELLGEYADCVDRFSAEMDRPTDA